MTKFILHGGMTNIPNIHNKKFYREMFKAAKGKPILACYYSRPESEKEYLLKSDTERMKRSIGNKKFEFIVASKNVKEFSKKILGSEAIYFRGGNTLKLQKRLEKIPRIKNLLKNKVILGSSAGALVFAKYYYDQDHNKILKGLGLLNVKMITHYLCTGEYVATSGKDKLKMLKDYKEKLPVYAIPETEFVVINS